MINYITRLAAWRSVRMLVVLAVATMLLIPAPTATYAKVYREAERCQPHAHANRQGNTLIKICSWINFDSTNNRIRAYGRVENVGGPHIVSMTVFAVHLEQDGKVVLHAVKATGAKLDFAETFTPLKNLGGTVHRYNAVVGVRVIYPDDGKQLVYTVRSGDFYR